MSAKTSSSRRSVRYSTLSDIIQDAEQLLSSHHTVGHWTFGQICQHLAKTMNCAFDGFGFQAPWFARWIIAAFVKNSLLIKPMRSGFQLPERGKAILPDDNISNEEGLRQMSLAIERFSHEVPTAPHPFLGKMASEEIVQLQLRHAEMHMSFIVPNSNGQAK
ncbi:MAG: DUF1569 domain-containing protein [Planctomycetia bacterium]|nr:DUF1569 domain-containing protein [Planctomycetia bacterium]